MCLLSGNTAGVGSAVFDLNPTHGPVSVNASVVSNNTWAPCGEAPFNASVLGPAVGSWPFAIGWLDSPPLYLPNGFPTNFSAVLYDAYGNLVCDQGLVGMYAARLSTTSNGLSINPPLLLLPQVGFVVPARLNTALHERQLWGE